jgi:Zn-dependent peptidase ImmA (M78 family)
MSFSALKVAKEIYQKYSYLGYPLDIEEVALAEGCEIVEWPFSGRVKEAKRGHWIGLAKNLDLPERRFLVAHALAHEYLHCGNQLSFHDTSHHYRNQQEKEADECAAHILIPEEELAKLGHAATVWEIAEEFEVPEELARQRLNDFSTETERRRWQSLEEG